MARRGRGWSFGIICGRAGREGVPMVCAEMLYAEYYWRQKLVVKGESNEVLPPLPKSHRKRHRRGKRYTNARRGRMPGRVDISERPKEVERRKEAGHWEGDLVNGAPDTGHLVTLVGTDDALHVPPARRHQERRRGGGGRRRAYGNDAPRAVENADVRQRQGVREVQANRKETGTPSSLRQALSLLGGGGNENRNGVVRKVLPKGTSFQGIADEGFLEIDTLLNNRPLRCPKWRTLREAFGELLKGGLGVA